MTASGSGATFQLVHYDYSRRGFLFPDGCKDLIDIIHPKLEITQRDSFVVRIELPGIESAGINVTVEGNTLRIIAKQGGSHTQYESTIEVPGGFAIAKARATYSNEQLRIVVPKAQA